MVKWYKSEKNPTLILAWETRYMCQRADNGPATKWNSAALQQTLRTKHVTTTFLVSEHRQTTATRMLLSIKFRETPCFSQNLRGWGLGYKTKYEEQCVINFS